MSKNTASKYAYGWLPDVPDHCDHLYAAPIVHLAKLPPKADLRTQSPPCWPLPTATTANASRGNKWGLKGYFTMPYAYLTHSNLADDLWTLRVVAA